MSDAVVLLDANTIDALAIELIEAATLLHGRRHILGIAGIPGSGKSTLAARLLERVNHHAPDIARLVPMDGFHFSNAKLDAMRLRDRKGAPETFDADAFVGLLSCAKYDFVSRMPVPMYDRSRHEPVLHEDDAHAITPATKLIITEGNYLLLNEPSWSQLAEVLDACWHLKVGERQAKEWIIARHVRGGRAFEDAVKHYERCDQENAQRVIAHQRQPDRVLRWA